MFSLIGEQLYAGKTNAKLGFSQSFDDFYSAFLSVFQVLTLSNWSDLETITLNTDNFRGLSLLFLISIIVIGNYIFLNLFIGILINGFIDQSEIKDEEEMEEINKVKAEQEAEDLRVLEQMNKNYEDLFIDEFVQKKDLNLKKFFEGIECQDSLFFFSKKWRVRKIIYQIVYSPIFESIILLIIVLSSIKLALDTYNLFGSVSDIIDVVFNIIFIVEACLKVISNGLFLDKGSYMRNKWTILDFIIVVISIVDMSMTDVNLSYQKVIEFNFL